MLEAFKRWIKRFGSRPWEPELQKAFEAGYRAGMRHDERAKSAPRSPNVVRRRKPPTPSNPFREKKPRAPKPVKPQRDLLLEALMKRAKDNE